MLSQNHKHSTNPRSYHDTDADADAQTVVENGVIQSDNGPTVDTREAAKIKPSKLSGRGLTFMVTFVAGELPCDWSGLMEGTGFTLFGYDQGMLMLSGTSTRIVHSRPGVMSGLLTLPAFEQAFPQTADGFGSSHSATLQSLAVAIYELGCMAGALSNLYVGDRLGRRHTISL